MRAYIVNGNAAQAPSNFRCQGTLEAYLKEQKVIGLCGVDTRALTRAIRENGVMNGIITDSKTLTPAQQALLDSYEIRGAVQAVTTPEVRRYEAEGEQKHRVALWDFGTKRRPDPGAAAKGLPGHGMAGGQHGGRDFGG